MQPNQLKVLAKFKENGRKGIIGADFPPMFAYTKRLSELRAMGYNIIDELEPNANKGMHKRYWLIGEPK